jgi:mono/diheme cytochrome c family protein
MKRKLVLFGLTLLIAILIGACGAGKGIDPTPLPYTPEPTPTRMPTPTQVVMGDSTAGQVVFDQNCSKCHSLEMGVELEGPSLNGAGSRLSASYVKESIETPCPEGFPSSEGEKKCVSSMPADFKEQLSSTKIDDVIAYVMSLK